MIFLNEVWVQKEVPTVVYIVERHRIENILMNSCVFPFYLVKDNECHITERQVKILLLDNPIMILMIEPMSILKWFSVSNKHAELWFSIARNITILFKNKGPIFHQYIWITFFIPNESIITINYLLVQLSIILYVPSEKHQLIQRLVNNYNKLIWVTSWSYFYDINVWVLIFNL